MSNGNGPHTALLILDAINPFDFPGAEDMGEAALNAAAVIADLRAAADAADIAVIYVNDNYGHWESEKAQIVREAAHASRTASGIIRQLSPREDDYFVIKPHFSGFYATNLTALLDRLQVGRLVITGYAADICVLFTAADAHMRGYELWTPRDAVASEGEERKGWALEIMAQSMGAKTEPTTELTLGGWAAKKAS